MKLVSSFTLNAVPYKINTKKKSPWFIYLDISQNKRINVEMCWKCSILDLNTCYSCLLITANLSIILLNWWRFLKLRSMQNYFSFQIFAVSKILHRIAFKTVFRTYIFRNLISEFSKNIINLQKLMNIYQTVVYFGKQFFSKGSNQLKYP